MSWAVGRCTKRDEDRAYSLLGLFEINIALLYGEGTKAFRRLQLKILQKYPDESIFAWQAETDSPYSVLATSPNSFENCSKMAPVNESNQASFLPLDLDPRRFNPARVTSWGIELRANARKLEPRQTLYVGGKVQRFLWAVTLTIAWEGSMRELPCTLVLVQSGPAPYSYRRFESWYCSPRNAFKYLQKQYEIGHSEENKLFYLQFDDDLG